MSPFVARFDTQQYHYLYDVNTNGFFRVSKLVQDLIEDSSRLTRHDLVAKFSTEYEPAQIAAALAELERFQQEEGVFSSHRPSRLGFPLDRERIGYRLGHSMEQLILEATDRCNLRCRYCIYSGHYPFRRVHGARTMSWDTARQALDLFAAGSSETESPVVSFYGGEPLLAFDLMKRVVEYAAAKPEPRPAFNLTTNGTLLTREVVDFLVANDFLVMVSLDGPSEIHDQLRVYADGRGSFQDVMGNLLALKQRYPDFYCRKVGFEVTLGLPDEIEAVDGFFAGNGELFARRYLSVSHVDSIDTGLFERGILPESEAGPLRRLYKRIEDDLVAGVELSPIAQGLLGSNLRKLHERSVEPLGETVHANGICCPGARRLFCTVSGDLTVCERANQSLVIGHAAAGVDRARAADLVEEYIRLSTPDCVNCWAVRSCSLCFANVFSDHLDLKRKRAVCDIMRAQVLNSMRLYCSVRERNPDAFDRAGGQIDKLP